MAASRRTATSRGWSTSAEWARSCSPPTRSSSPGTGSANPFGANINLSQIATIQQQIGRFDGAAMQTFAANYANRLPIVVDGQDAVACFLWLGVAGEQEIWKRAMQGIADIAAQGKVAMETCDDGGGDASAVLYVASALASVIGVVPGLGTGVSIGVKLAGTALGAASKFAPKPPETVPLGAGNPITVLDNIQGAIDKLKQQIADEEDELARRMTTVENLVHVAAPRRSTSPSRRSTTTPTRATSAPPTTPGSTSERCTTSRRSTMPLVAGEIRKAADQFEGAASMSPGRGRRGSARAATGPTSSGPRSRTRSTGILNNTAQELDRAADHLEIVANDFEKTDAQIHADLEAHAEQVDKEDEPRLAPTGTGGHRPI